MSLSPLSIYISLRILCVKHLVSLSLSLSLTHIHTHTHSHSISNPLHRIYTILYTTSRCFREKAFTHHIPWSRYPRGYRRCSPKGPGNTYVAHSFMPHFYIWDYIHTSYKHGCSHFSPGVPQYIKRLYHVLSWLFYKPLIRMLFTILDTLP